MPEFSPDNQPEAQDRVMAPEAALFLLASRFRVPGFSEYTARPNPTEGHRVIESADGYDTPGPGPAPEDYLDLETFEYAPSPAEQRMAQRRYRSRIKPKQRRPRTRPSITPAEIIAPKGPTPEVIPPGHWQFEGLLYRETPEKLMQVTEFRAWERIGEEVEAPLQHRLDPTNELGFRLYFRRMVSDAHTGDRLEEYVVIDKYAFRLGARAGTAENIRKHTLCILWPAKVTQQKTVFMVSVPFRNSDTQPR